MLKIKIVREIINIYLGHFSLLLRKGTIFTKLETFYMKKELLNHKEHMVNVLHAVTSYVCMYVFFINIKLFTTD